MIFSSFGGTESADITMEIKSDEAISLMALNEILKPSLNLHEIDDFTTTTSNDFYKLTVMTGRTIYYILFKNYFSVHLRRIIIFLNFKF